MKLVGGLLLLIAASAAAPDDVLPPVTYPTLPTFVRQASEFVPDGWKTVAIKTGDLNSDKHADVAVLMRMTDPANIERLDKDRYYKEDDTNPYLLAIGLAHGDGYALAASNHSLFPTATAPIHGDDPPSADTMTIARGVLTMTFGHLRGYDQFRFRWNGKAFALVGYDCASVVGNGGIISELSANFLTGKARIGGGVVGSDKTDVSNVRMRSAKRPTLDQFDHLESYFQPGTDVRGHELGC